MKPRVASEYTAPRRAPLHVAESVGEPAAISCLARMLLKLHARPGLQLVEAATDEQPRDLLPAVEQGPL